VAGEHREAAIPPPPAHLRWSGQAGGWTEQLVRQL